MDNIFRYHEDSRIAHWANMERKSLIVGKLDDHTVKRIANSSMTDTAPCELNYDHQGGDPA